MIIKSTILGRVGLTHASCECAVEICPQISEQNKRGLFSPLHNYHIQDIDSEPDSDSSKYHVDIACQPINDCEDSDSRHEDSDLFFHCFIGS